mgnify:CR=1 FL=1
MNRCIVDNQTNELIAYISDTHENIVKDGYEILEYGCSEPVFTDDNGRIYVKDNKFTIELNKDNYNWRV